MKKIIVLLLLVFACDLAAAKYLYFYKNGKKYRKKLDDRYDYKIIEKDGKKYIAKKLKQTPTIQDPIAQEPTIQSSVKQKTAKKEKIGFFIELDLANINTTYNFNAKTNVVNCSNGSYCSVTNPYIDGNFLADGNTTSSKTKKITNAIILNLGYEMLEQLHVITSMYDDTNNFYFSFGLRVLPNFLQVNDFRIFLDANLDLVYDNFSKFLSMGLNSVGFSYGLGMQYHMDDFFASLGANMGSVELKDEKNKFATESLDLDNVKIFLGIGYRF